LAGGQKRNFISEGNGEVRPSGFPATAPPVLPQKNPVRFRQSAKPKQPEDKKAGKDKAIGKKKAGKAGKKALGKPWWWWFTLAAPALPVRASPEKAV
jgi:hypothetical protein